MLLPHLLLRSIGAARARATGSSRVLLAGLLVLGLACSRAPERVVLVTIDTLRADFVGCYGAFAAHTPTIDGLAERGVRFTNAISPTPLTLPSHASLLTGLDPPQHGLRGNAGHRLPDGIVTLAERLHAEGFATAAFVGAKVLDRQFGLARGFDVYDDRMSSRLAGGDLSYAERSADVVVDSALAWLEEAPSRFLLWVHLYDPHGNYQPPPGFLAMFPGDPYVGEIAFADAEIGRLLARVHERFDDALTLTVVTSDHGESRGEHGELTHSLSIYDATQRVPLVVSGPGFPAGVIVERPVGLIDVAQTILSVLGAPLLPEARGVDLRTALEDAHPEERLLYVETLEPHATFGWSPLLGLRSQSRKYIRAPRPELYELMDDPRELHNRASERDDEVARLDAALSERLAEVRRAPALAMDAGTRAALQALGYLAPETRERRTPGEVGGIDPKDGMPMAQRFMIALQMHGSGRTEDAL